MGKSGNIASPAALAAGQAAGKDAAWPWFLFAGYALVALALRLPWLGDPATGYDEQLYHLFGVRMLEGDLPYVDLWDRKPLLLFGIFAAGAVISGKSVLGYQALVIAFAAIGATQSYLIARRLGDATGGVIAGIMYLIVFPLFDTPMGQAEIFYVPLLLGMLQLLIAVFERDTLAAVVKPACAAMALGGLALQIKYTVLPHCLFAGVAVLWRMHRLGAGWRPIAGHAVVFALIGLAPTLMVAGFYAATGHFGDFFYANFQSIFERGSIDDQNVLQNIRQLAILSAWFWLMAIIAVVLVVRGKRRQGSAYVLTAGMLIASLVAAGMVGNIYIHYFIPAAVALMLLGVPALSPGLVNRVLAIYGIALSFFFSGTPIYVYLAHEDRGVFPQAVEAVRPYVGQHDNCLFVYEGVVALYQAANSCLPTRYIFPDQLNSAQEANAIGVDATAELRRILATRPGAIITKEKSAAAVPNQANWSIVTAELAKNYSLTRRIVTRMGTIETYVRRDRLQAIPAVAPASGQ